MAMSTTLVLRGGRDKVEPTHRAIISTTDGQAFAWVDVLGLNVQSDDPEQLLAISTAFADAAHQLMRLTGDLPSAVTA